MQDGNATRSADGQSAIQQSSTLRYMGGATVALRQSLHVVVVLALLSCAAVSPAASQVIITEFMASNSRTLADEDGSFEDWIEVFNSGATTVNLLNWSLTDAPGNLNKWRFPATNLTAGSFLVVFASDKNRATPGSNLHTNFRLSAGAEYLALVEPDGVTIATQFAPVFPPQATDVSFGFGVQFSTAVPVATGNLGRVFVPANDALGSNWIVSSFDDSGWLAATNGVGFDTGVPDPNEDSYALAVAASGPVAWYRFEETSGTLLTNAGSLGVAATNLNLVLDRSGPRPPLFGGFETANRAANFNGSSGRLRVPDNVAFDFGSGPFAIEMWFNPAAAGTRGDLFTYKGPEGDFGIHVASQGANTLSVYHNAFIGTGGGISNNVWYHLVVSRAANGQVTVHLNGAVLFTGNDTATLSIANDLLVGSNHTGSPATGSLFFNGLIDEVAIYNRALTASEAVAHYQRALGGGAAYASLIQTDLRAVMHGANSSAFIRLPFTITNVATLDRLVLRMKYDDGFTAWINGEEIASRNAPAVLAWNSAATAIHPDAQAVVFEDFEIAEFRNFVHDGVNVLAIQGLNITADNADFLVSAEVLATDIGGLDPQPRYFLQPTPGAINGVGSADVGPIISDARHTPALPARPANDDDIVVTARVAPAFAPVTNVMLSYRVMFGITNTLAMVDDGVHGDGPAGDGVFGATIPASASTNGQMVRWFIRATDAAGRSSRWPLFEDPLGSPEYLGTVIANVPAVTSALLIWEWFAQDVTAARNVAGTRGAVFHQGRFYDNVRIRRRGAATTVGQKFDFNRNFRCFISDELTGIDEVNLNNEASDASYIRPPMAYEAFRVAGNAACLSFNMLMRVNGGVDRTGVFIEQVDERFLERNGLDPAGALYKFVQRGALTPIFTEPNDGVEKKTRLTEDRSDLQAVCTALQLTNNPAQLAQRRAFILDNFNVPALINHVACRAVTMDSDDVRKNIYLHRDTLGNREWTIFPWDKDWTFGVLGDGGPFLRHPFFGDRLRRKDNALQWSLLYEAVFTDLKLSEMYLRRLRTVMDQQLQPPGTPASLGYLESRADAWRALVFPHVGAAPSNEVNNIKNTFLSGATSRRTDLYVTYATTNLSAPAANRLVPGIQLPIVAVQIGDVEYNPASGNQAEEYVQLTNNNPFAIDVSGWRLDGAVQHTFRAGTVIGSNSAMYVSPDVVAFRARAAGPRGGQGLLVQGNYIGQLSARGETLALRDDRGRLVHTNRYVGSPSLAQQYLRITELMYHPAALAGNTNGAEEFEFIELKNISTNVALDLAGVRFVNGVNFNFTGSAVTSLLPGQSTVVVKNPVAFAARYGGGLNVAGQYVGSLENRGERLQLVDASGEEILDFSYNNNWHPITDGFGFSLVVVDEHAEPDAWGRSTQWRPSGMLNGSPAGADPAPPTFAPVVISEALTRTDLPPPTDTIELHNPLGTMASIGGWFLSDDFNQPRKYRIVDGTSIGAGGFVTFNEAQFNTGPAAFALSSDGDEVWLFSADAAGNLTGYFHGHRFGAAEDGVSFGRHVTSTGEEHFVAQITHTLGTGNAGPKVGPVVISEILYRPPDLADGSDNGTDEFIELLNISGDAVPLFDPLVPTNTWRISGGVDFVFPTNQMLETYALLVSFDPATNAAAQAAFRGRYNVDPAVPLFGPYSSKLDNSAADVELKKPTTAVAGVVPYVFVDQVEYRDSAPWPAAADGSGASLQRANNAAYGNDPTNWLAATPSAGRPRSAGGIAPSITSQPANQTVTASSTVTLNVTASGGGPLRYQWRRDGAALPGKTNSALILNNIQASDAGDYSVLIYNNAGSTVSSNGTLSVIYAAFILQQPGSVQVRVRPDPLAAPTTNAAFGVLAYSTSPLHYQWRYNGTEIPGATASTLVITNVQVANDGEYTCAVTDDIGTTFTAPAMLIPLVSTVVTQGLVAQSVAAGASVTLSVAATGHPLPFSYEWRRGSIMIASNYVASRADFLTFTANAAPFTTNLYRVIVRNLANTGVSANSSVNVITRPDFDQDGIIDAYEQSIGLNTNNAADATGDLDNDRMNNRDEVFAGTDPLDPASYLRVDLRMSANQALVSIGTVSNRTYTVQYTDELVSGNWIKLADLPARTTNRVETITDSSTNRHRAYRLVTPRQP